MKTLRNYKHIRKKPQIWGFSLNSFYCFLGIVCISVFYLASDFTWKKLIIALVFDGVGLIITKLVVGNEKFERYFFDQKFPEEISDLTKK